MGEGEMTATFIECQDNSLYYEKNDNHDGTKVHERNLGRWD